MQLHFKYLSTRRHYNYSLIKILFFLIDLSNLGQNPELERREMDERSFSEDDQICFFLTEKDTESQISCKHRLTRSKFNSNPFGLRFGKRDELQKSDKKRLRFKKLLPLLLFMSELEETSWISHIPHVRFNFLCTVDTYCFLNYSVCFWLVKNTLV